MLKNIQLTKRNIIGKWGYHQFKKEGFDDVFVTCTEEEYRALGLAGASAPIYEDYTWHKSGEWHKYDTISGGLGENEYGLDEFGNAIVRMVAQEAVLPKEHIVTDKITQDGVDFIVKHNQLENKRSQILEASKVIK
ncbi:MAG: hypothetical protein WAV09_01115 [Minisyncoccia bacterium]